MVRREVACGGCGVLLYVSVPGDAAGMDRCECWGCGGVVQFRYEDADPMPGSLVVEPADGAGEEEVPF